MINVIEGGFYGLSFIAGDVLTIFVTPQGLGNGWANTNGNDAITFRDEILENIDFLYCIYQNRRFVTGWSWGGGGMSHSVACSRAGVPRCCGALQGRTRRLQWWWSSNCLLRSAWN